MNPVNKGKRGKTLKNFFNPETIAVVGASDNPKKVGYALMKKLMKFKGRVIPINVKHEKIFGKKAYKRVVDFKGKIDLAIIAIPALFIKNVLKDCGNKKIKNVIVISAGFSEIGNYKLEKEIIRIAKKYKMNLLGPNCFGIANLYKNLDTTFSKASVKKGDIAFISQSGALWSYIADISTLKNIGFSGFVSLGNMADLDFSDFIEYFGKDNKTKKIILYVEKIKNGKKFIKACKVAKKFKKEIIAIKAGKSKKGKEATISHTGSLATDYEIYKGVFKQANVKLVDSLSLAFGFKNNFKSKISQIKNKNLIIITNAGGAGALLADFFSEKNNVEKIKDLIGTALAGDYKRVIKKINQRKYDFIITVLTPQTMSQPEETAKVLVDYKFKNKIIAFFLGDKSIKQAKRILEKNEIPCFTNI